eukprot:1310376-Pyramimonas_sp.AAC.1
MGNVGNSAGLADQIPRVGHTTVMIFDMLAKRSKAPADTLPSETRCELCGTDYDDWFHMLMACKHEDIVEY